MNLRMTEAYDGAPACIGVARRTVKAFLALVGTEHLVLVPAATVGRAQLVVSELVTNAVRHSDGGCGLDLVYRAGRVEITVWDASTAAAVTRAPDPARVGGHGLEIVQAICGPVHVTTLPGGKRVRARMPVFGV